MQLVNVPNVITLARALLVPVVTYALATRDYDLALALFLACAIGDFLDGWIARRFDLRTRFGALVYHWRIGHVEMAPTRWSKANTALEFVLLASVLAVAAGLVERDAWLAVLLWACTATIVVSGVQYVVLWSRKASEATATQRAAAR
jgi:cardiolipin synthase